MKYQVIHNFWPEVLRTAEEAYGYSEAVMPRFRPSPADVSDMLPALEWVRGLERREWRLIWWKSFGISFRHIGLRIGRSDETARRHYKDVMLKVWHNANFSC